MIAIKAMPMDGLLELRNVAVQVCENYKLYVLTINGYCYYKLDKDCSFYYFSIFIYFELVTTGFPNISISMPITTTTSIKGMKSHQ